jgi:hypothetical protein
MYKVASILILYLIGGTLAVGGQEWLSPWTYDQDAGSYLTDPLFYPWTSQAEKDLYESQYYPYFGEDFSERMRILITIAKKELRLKGRSSKAPLLLTLAKSS